MVDIARDPRWGRIIEGAGEDPYLGAAVAVAQVRGFQGGELGAPGPRHRRSEALRRLRGARSAGATTTRSTSPTPSSGTCTSRRSRRRSRLAPGNVMTAYMDLNGIPAAGNRWLFTEVLRETLGVRGLRGQRRQRRTESRHPWLRARIWPMPPHARSTRASTWRWRSRTPPTRTCPRRWSQVQRAAGGRRERPAGAGGKASDGPLRRSRTSTRTAPARCSPIRHTATWPASPPSDRQCSCATRATCCRSTPAA